jgi:hypothetical protein
VEYDLHTRFEGHIVEHANPVLFAIMFKSKAVLERVCYSPNTTPAEVSFAYSLIKIIQTSVTGLVEPSKYSRLLATVTRHSRAQQATRAAECYCNRAYFYRLLKRFHCMLHYAPLE